MLSRTADHLFWMARYIERAENTARILDVNVQRSLLPQPLSTIEAGWLGTLEMFELMPAFEKQHSSASSDAVLQFMIRDRTNPSSIVSCIYAARENARAVRGSLTTEVFETHNLTWLEIQRLLDERLPERDPGQFFDWVKFRSHLSRGVTIGTMLRDEALHFTRLGTFLERADNTARLLDVRFHGSRTAALATARDDYYHWAAVLRSCSAFEIYRKAYSDVITPERVAELLILRSDMPRSLCASIDEVCTNLDLVGDERARETRRQAGLLRAELKYGRIEDILEGGLHAWLTVFLARVAALGLRIANDFLLPIEADHQVQSQ
jgi:uncharacterized alpha-E superfamily protein